MTSRSNAVWGVPTCPKHGPLTWGQFNICLRCRRSVRRVPVMTVPGVVEALHRRGGRDGAHGSSPAMHAAADFIDETYGGRS